MNIAQWDPERITSTVVDEFGAFASLMHQLDGTDLRADTRCTGWTVCHVAGHVTGTILDILGGMIGQRTPDQQAEAYLGWSSAQFAAVIDEVAQRLDVHLSSLPPDTWTGPVEGVPGQLFSTGVITLLHELCVHTDDIDHALNRSSLSPQLVEISTQWLATEFDRLAFEPMTVEIVGQPNLTVGFGGPAVRTDPLSFVRAATGRIAGTDIGLDDRINIYGRDRGHIGV